MTEQTFADPGELLPERADAPHRGVSRCDVPRDLDQQLRLADALCRSGVMPGHLRGQPANLLGIMYAASALDVPLWQAVSSMQNIDGKVGLSADLMRALWLRAGHKFKVIERTKERAVVEAWRVGDDPYRLEYSIDDAVDAGLVQLKDGKPYARSKNGNPQPWEKFTKNMLVARATSTVLREIGSDVLMGFYTPDELSDGKWDDSELAAVQVTVHEAATEAASWDQIAKAFRDIDAAPTEEAARELGNQFWKAGILDAEREGVSLKQTVANRIAALKPAADEADVVDAEVVEDAEPEGSTAPSTQPTPDDDGLVECSKCDGKGAVDGAQCWICLGAGRVAA